MPFPFITVIAALAAGGTLVPHAAGGLMVTAATGGYVAGTYLSTAAIAALLTAATASVGALSTALAGLGATIWGTAGFLGTTVGATGIKGVLMTVGIIPSTPLWVPIAGVSAVLLMGAGSGYLIHQIDQLKKKCQNAAPGHEAQFSEADAKSVEGILKALHKKQLIKG